MFGRSLIIFLLLYLNHAWAHPSVSIVMDDQGNVYYSDLKQVWRIDTKEKKSIVVSGVHTHELFLDKEGNLYGEHLWYNSDSDSWSHYVWKRFPDGKIEKIVLPSKAFSNDFSFVQDRNGNMFWPDSHKKCQCIIRKSKGGLVTRLGDACLNNIRWIISSPEGIVYLIDGYDLKKVDQNGHVTIVVTDIPDKMYLSFINPTHFLSGLSLDKNGNVFIADYSGRQVKRVGPDNRMTVFAETKAPWNPIATLLDKNGDFWILENSNSNEVRMERITKDGRRVVY